MSDATTTVSKTPREDLSRRGRAEPDALARGNGVRGGDWYAPAALAVALVATSFYSYLLFHTLIELATLVIALVVFIVTWSTYREARKHYVTALGCGYLWIGVIDLLRMLAYRGMQALGAPSGGRPA